MGDEPASRGRWRLERFATIDSTNRWLLDEARRGAEAGLVAVADEQTSGRGRRGRTWVAPPGSSLLVSVLLRPTLSVERAHLLTMAVALAVRDAIERVCGLRAELKWPNDLVVGDRKLAGVLAEAELAASGDARAVVVGVGANIDWPAIPDELEGIATSCNLETGRDVDRDEVLDAFLDVLGHRLADLEQVAVDYRAGLATLGRRVRVDLGDHAIEGTAVGVDDAGRLLVEDEDGRGETIAAGDVVHLRPV